MEYFKFIDGYPHLLISTKGRVVSVLHDREIKPYISNRGYLRVALCLNRKLKNYHVHRLVAEAFIPNPNGYTDVDHIDGNKLNNNVENLQWLSRGDNIRKAGNKRFCGAKPVICVETGKVYHSISEAAKELHITPAIISAIAKGEYKSYHKLHFKYYNNN
jgi:hypothetical protein